MNKTNSNALAGLIGSYGDSGDESDDERKISGANVTAVPAFTAMPPPGMLPSVLAKTGMHSQPLPSMHQNYASPGQAPPLPPNVLGQEVTGPTIHPAPIAHCPWSACYDEGSGFTYYWNQTTNAVTWEAPPEYLMALKLAQQQLHTSGSTEVSLEEWHLYQQALIDKQNAAKISMRPAPVKPKKEKMSKDKNGKVHNRKRVHSEDDNDKIELITSYHNSDSESDPESEVPVKAPEIKPPPPLPPSKPPKVPHKKPKTKTMEYGPALPPKQNYTMPIGPEMPKELLISSKAEEEKVDNEVKIENIPAIVETEDIQDENSLLRRLKDKAKLLEKLGGELPTGLENIIKDTKSGTTTPTKTVDDVPCSDIDDLLEEIEKKEMPKTKLKKIDMFDENSQGSNDSYNSIQSGTSTPVTPKPLFPSSQNIDEPPALFPSAAKIEEVEVVIEKDIKAEAPPIVAAEKKGTNLYLSDPSEPIERTRKKLRISNSVLPERKKTEMPSYTTKYSQHIEGFSNERVGLGFSQDSDGVESPKAKTVSYGNGLTFTKGEVLNEKDEDLDSLTDLVEAKLKHLNELQSEVVSPVQEMLIQMQTLRAAFVGGALSGGYWRRWARAAHAALAAHEARAAPPGWTCSFQRAARRYRYRRADGFEQWEYPAVPDTDMEICTTPPPPPQPEEESLPPPPPLPLSPPPPAPQPPAPLPAPAAPSPPARRVRTPPPPAWHDPPPPGCDDLPPLPPPEPKKQEEIKQTPPKQEIGDELLSFYNDLAELEKQAPSTEPTTRTPSPPAPLPVPVLPIAPYLPPVKIEHRKKESMERETTSKTEKDKDKVKRKTKVKISTSMGLKQKTVSNMVAKWQQVADEINSD